MSQHQWLDEDPDVARRRKLAERLARELATAPTEGSDYVTSLIIQVRLRSAIEFQIALSETARVIAMSPWPYVGHATGRNGAVLYAHGPDLWSSVFPIKPFTGLILVCADDLHDNCMQLHNDGADTRKAAEDFRTNVLLSLANRRDAIASGFLPPDLEPLPATP